MAVGNWVTYGFNKATLPAAEKAAKDKSASIYAQIAADRVENITFEDIDIVGSLNGGIRVSDMLGDVTLRDVRIIRKPGTRNLLSTISDALHLMNIRGRVVMEDCVVEAAGDDCLNIGAQRDNIIALDASDKRTVTLRSTDNWYYYYTIREGDRLQFLDTASKRVLGVRTVTAAAFNPRNRAHTVTLDREVPGLAPETTQVMNLNHITQSTVIRNNTITPYTRNALLARAQNMTIEGNKLGGLRSRKDRVSHERPAGSARLRLWQQSAKRSGVDARSVRHECLRGQARPSNHGRLGLRFQTRSRLERLHVATTRPHARWGSESRSDASTGTQDITRKPQVCPGTEFEQQGRTAQRYSGGYRWKSWRSLKPGTLKPSA